MGAISFLLKNVELIIHIPLANSSVASCPTQFAFIRSIDDLEQITAFKLARGASSSSTTSASSSAASASAPLRYEYGCTLHFKDRAELHLLVRSPTDAWPEKCVAWSLVDVLCLPCSRLFVALLSPFAGSIARLWRRN